MNAASLRELGVDLMGERQLLRALGVFAESVRRQPADHRARMLAARCLRELGEPERAVLVLHACAEGLLRRDFLLSAMAACKQALQQNPQERMVRRTLEDIHARAIRTAPGRAQVPPQLPPAQEAVADVDLMALEGSALEDKALEVLLQPDPSRIAERHGRPPLPLFADLSAEAFLELVQAMDYRPVLPGTILSEAGEEPEALYVLVAGKAEVAVNQGGHERTVGFLGGGSMFGEVALLTGTLPTATVTAAVHSELFVLSREVLRTLVTRHPEVAETLARFGQQRLAQTLLQGGRLFQALAPGERPALLARFEYRVYRAGEPVARESEPSDGLVLVLAGELAVKKAPGAEGEPLLMGYLRDGDVAGEISLLKGVPATATVTATRRTAAAFLPREHFTDALARHPSMRALLERLSTERLAQLSDAVRPAEVLDADELVVE